MGLFFFCSFVGASKLKLERRDIHKDLMKKRCEVCKESPLCKTLGKCDTCKKICETEPVKETKRENDEADLMSLQSRSNADSGLNENENRYFTVGAFGTGPTQKLLARLLHIKEMNNIRRLIVLAETKAKNPVDETAHPLVIDTAHVFTRNNGQHNLVDVEVHDVNNNEHDMNEVLLTQQVNKELDMAMEVKKQERGDSHLTPEEVDKIIDHAVAQVRLPKRLFKKFNENPFILG